MSFLKQMLGLEGASQTGTRTTTNNTTSHTALDPAIQNLIFGGNGSQGLISQYSSLLNQPQSQPLQQYGNTAGAYLNNFGASDMNATHAAATNLIGGNAAPQVGAPAWAVGNQVQAPSQNNIDLTSTYNSLLGGGNNAALKDSLKYGTDLTSAQFQKNQTDLTNNLQRNILPGIRSNSVLAGQYGGSRQGIAEGNALSDYTNQLTNANTQIGLANSANTTGQLANSYEQGQNRALAAAQGLSGQQYGTAAQNANTKNQAEFMNVGQVQQNNLANQSAQLQTNAQNNSSALAGAGLLGGQTSAAYGAATNNQNYGLNQAQGVNSLLAPYLNANSTTTTNSTGTQPIYENKGQNFLSTVGNLASLFG